MEIKIIVPKKEAETIRHYLEHEPKDHSECLGEDKAITYTADFGNGIEMNVKVCGARYDEDKPNNRPWTEAVLFKEGYEVACTGVSEDFFGEWELEGPGGITYKAVVAEEWVPAYPVFEGIMIKDTETLTDALAAHAGSMEEIEGVGLLDGFEAAVAGFTGDNRVVYSYEKMLDVLMGHDNMGRDEAVEYMDYNVIRILPYMGRQPVILYPVDCYEMEDKT